MSVRTVAIEPGRPLPYVRADWAGVLVVVARGVLSAERRDGGRLRFGAGEVLWLAGLPLVALHAGATRDPRLALKVLSPPDARTAPSTPPRAPRAR